MADSYSKWLMTTAFANNSQAALNSGGKIEWVSLKTSDDAHQVADLDGFNDTTLATANIKQISGISSVTISGNTVTITGLFNSTNNASDYYIRTIFLVAKYNGKEFLAGTTVANTSGSAFRMPASSNTEITEFTARPQISVTNTNSISTTVDPVASATNERVDSLEATLQGEIDDINVDKQNLWNKLADYVTKAAAETITGVKTFSQTIVGSITGNAGTATKLQTERTIGFSGDVNGTVQGFDGSKDITLPINLNSINQNNTTSTQSAGYNSPVTIIDGITRDTKGRVTGVNTKTVTLPPVQTTISGNAASATKLETARLIGGVSFDGTSDIILPGVNSIGTQNTTGNAATATNADLATKAVALQTQRNINGIGFDGTYDITVDPVTHVITLPVDIFTLPNGFYYNSGADSTNKPSYSSIYFTFEVIQTSQNGFIRLVDHTGKSFWTTKDGGSWREWRQDANDSTVVHNTGTETVAGNKTLTGNNTFTQNISGNITGNSGTTTKLQTTRNINGVGFDGTYDITVDPVVRFIAPDTDLFTLPNGFYCCGGVALPNKPAGVGSWFTVEVVQNSTDGFMRLVDNKGMSFWTSKSASAWGAWHQDSDNSTVVHNWGDESIGGTKTFSSTINGNLNGNSTTVTKLQTARTIGGVSFDGTSDITLPGVNAKGNQDTSGRAANATNADRANNAASADIANKAVALNTSRNINGVGFDGTSDITIDPSTRTISTATDLFTLPNGFYLNAGVESTNRPNGATWFTVEVIQTKYNGLMRLIDSDGLSFWTSKSGGYWGAWHQDADDSTVVHNYGNENVGGDKTFTGNNTLNGVTTVNSAKSSGPITKTITTSAPITLNFSETAFGVMVYGSCYGQFRTEGQWKMLATIPAEISAPIQIVTLNDVGWAGVGGVTYRLGIGLKIMIKPNREILYKVTSLKENDNTAYDVQTDFDLSTYWSK